MAKYFTDDEFACKCGCNEMPEGGMHPRLIEVLDAMREALGKPLIVTSGYRCPMHNEAVGGVPNSFHVQGVAADVTYEGVDVHHLGKLAEAAGADGIGIYAGGWVHVDVRGEWARWWE